jgi:hypothetical protein
LFSIGIGFSQALVTQEVTRTMSKGAQSGIQGFIQNVSEDNLEEAIKDVTKPYRGKKRSIKRMDEFFLDDAKIKEISINTIDVYQTIEKGNDGILIQLFLIYEGYFLTIHTAQINSLMQ